MRTCLRHNVKIASITSAVFFLVGGGFTSIGFLNHYQPAGLDSASDAQLAYQTAVYQAAQQGHRFSSAPAIAAQIERKHPQFDASVASSEASALRYLHHHYGYYGTLLVVPRDDNQVELVARHRSDAVERLIGDSRGKHHDSTYSVRHWKWYPWDLVLGLEGGGLLLASLLIAYLCALGDAGTANRGRERWEQIVPADCLYGPPAPEVGFTILNPVCIDHHGEPWFTFEVLTYKGDWWRRGHKEERETISNPDGTQVEKVVRAGRWQDYTPLPTELTAVRVDPQASPEDVAEKWFRYCHGVAAWNAACWQRRQEQDLRLEQAQALAKVPLREILQPGHEIVRGLSVEPKA